jgi:hypothetical protein
LKPLHVKFRCELAHGLGFKEFNYYKFNYLDLFWRRLVSVQSRNRCLQKKFWLLTCADTSSDEPSEVSSESDYDDSADNGSYSDFEPEIAMKIKKAEHDLSSDSESGSAEKQVCNNESEI